MSYTMKQRRPAEQLDGSRHQEASPTEWDSGPMSAMWESSLDAIENVQPYAGRKLNLDEAMAARMQDQFGIRMDQVELRESSQATDMDAKAFVKGNVVQFAPGQFRPDTQQGQQLLQHELAHVAQQARGGVRADVAGLNVNADPALEHQADLGAVTASAGAPVSVGGMNAQAAPVQGVFGGIKNFFRKIKRSFRVGRALRGRDDVVRQLTNEYEDEQSRIARVMRANGYTDEEIQAQQLFQRINQSNGRMERYQDALSDVRESSGDLQDATEMANLYARMGRGAVQERTQRRRTQREEHLRDEILTGAEHEEEARNFARVYQMRMQYNAAKESARRDYENNPDDQAISNRHMRFGRTDDTSDIAMMDTLSWDSPRARAVQARSSQFFAAHPGYSAGTTTRDLVRFLGNGTNADFNVSDAAMDNIYQAVEGSGRKQEDPEEKKRNAQNLIQPVRNSVAVLQNQMAALTQRHNRKPTSTNDIALRYNDMIELYKKAQITRDIASQVQSSGAVSPDDPLYHQLADDLDYARSVCNYAIELSSSWKNVNDGSQDAGSVATFADIQASIRNRRANLST